MAIPIPSTFQRFEFSDEEIKNALKVNDVVFAYIQNKMALYADSLVHEQQEWGVSPETSLQAILKLERRRAQIAILEELLVELETASSAQISNPQE